jgi:hypothetical protein
MVRDEEQIFGGRQRRRQHDPHGYRRAREAGATGRAALGDEGGQHHQQRVGERGGHVHHVRPQPANRLHQHVLGQFRGVKRHIREVPAGQQQVAVQHRPRLQRDRCAVRTDGQRPRLAQRAQEQHHRRDRKTGGPGRPPYPRQHGAQPGTGRRFFAVTGLV